MPTPSRTKRPPAKPAARAADGKFLANGSEGACSIHETNKKTNAATNPPRAIPPSPSQPQPPPPKTRSRPRIRARRHKSTKAPKSPKSFSRKPASILPQLQQGIERPRVAMGSALRHVGLDEIAVAEGYAGVVKKLGNKNDSGDGVEKLFVDVLKEISRNLDQPRPVADAPAASDARITINLIHQVQRPVRPQRPASDTIAAANDTPPLLPAADSTADL